MWKLLRMKYRLQTFFGKASPAAAESRCANRLVIFEMIAPTLGSDEIVQPTESPDPEPHPARTGSRPTSAADLANAPGV